jgi:uncharacterized protein YoaH (UPF0181 family)
MNLEQELLEYTSRSLAGLLETAVAEKAQALKGELLRLAATGESINAVADELRELEKQQAIDQGKLEVLAAVVMIIKKHREAQISN